MMKLFRISGFLALGVAVFLGSLLFWTSQSVQHAEDRLQALRKSVAFEEESIRVLDAEWDYLNRPQRLEELARDHLDMEPAAPNQMIETLDDIPEPSLPVLPKMKPIPVSTKPAAQKEEPAAQKPKPEAIQNRERKSFDSLLKELDQGGAE